MKKQQGISLIEVLIALLVLAGGIITLAKFQGDLLRARVDLNQQSQAVMLAQNKIEDLRHYTVINTTGGKKAYDDIASGTSTVSGTSTTYTVTWTVTDNSSPPHKVVRVTVSWTDSKNVAQSVTLDSIVGKVDPTTSGQVTQGL